MVYLKHIFELFKANLILLIQVILTFLIPIQDLMILVAVMVGIDTITGIWKARKTGERITSRKLSHTVSKMALYQCALLTVFIIEKLLLGEIMFRLISVPLFLTKVVCIFLCGIEALSVNENITLAYGFNFFKSFKNMLIRIKGIKKDVNDIIELKDLKDKEEPEPLEGKPKKKKKKNVK